MKNTLVPIDKAGRVVLPKRFREELSLHPGDLLRAEIRGLGLVLTPNQENTGLVREGKALVFSTPGDEVLATETVQELLEAERQEPVRGASKALKGTRPRP